MAVRTYQRIPETVFNQVHAMREKYPDLTISQLADMHKISKATTSMFLSCKTYEEYSAYLVEKAKQNKANRDKQKEQRQVPEQAPDSLSFCVMTTTGKMIRLIDRECIFLGKAPTDEAKMWLMHLIRKGVTIINWDHVESIFPIEKEVE